MSDIDIIGAYTQALSFQCSSPQRTIPQKKIQANPERRFENMRS